MHWPHAHGVSVCGQAVKHLIRSRYRVQSAHHRIIYALASCRETHILCDEGRVGAHRRLRMKCLTAWPHSMTPCACGQCKKPHGKSSHGAGEPVNSVFKRSLSFHRWVGAHLGGSVVTVKISNSVVADLRHLPRGGGARTGDADRIGTTAAMPLLYH